MFMINIVFSVTYCILVTNQYNILKFLNLKLDLIELLSFLVYFVCIKTGRIFTGFRFLGG